MKIITSVVNSPAKETWELEKEIEIMTLPAGSYNYVHVC